MARGSGRGRPSKEQYLIYFDATAYIKDLKKVMNIVAKELIDGLVLHMKRNLSSIPFKSNVVKVGRKGATSDAQRKSSVINSIIPREIKSIRDSLVTHSVSALGMNFEDSHIGLYYEHGTGEKQDGTFTRIKNAPFSMEEWSPNPHRSGKTIVSRSKYIDYSGHGKGIWIDLGGNWRRTGSKKGGETNDKFRNYIGPDINAYHWFKRAIDNIRLVMRKAIVDAMRKLPLKNYIRMNNLVIL